MKASVAIKDGDHQSTFALYEWLRSEEDLRGRVKIGRERPRPGEMGDLATLVTVAVGSGGILSVFIGSLATWLTQRRRETTIKVTLSDGRSIEVSSTSGDHTETLLKSVLDQAKELD